ncbi:hypothetical protein JRO89_XS14G0076100 [Xanthoceras sorbifolium]|uniref:Homeobox domain-containing protein n=1 Tax=Xanthoceras sorbifolium TaxID=99658 RepID=A0ABQ8H4B6_9ROSI|nr:hypothetical protein JRO89_XS14G0076100 [Xanthoceras sorbifolium]
MTTTRSSSSSVPLGPFTGYASILMRSRFLKPAQQSLDDFCSGGFYSCEAIILSDFLHHHHHHHHYHHHHQVDGFSGESESVLLRDFFSFSDRIEHSWKNSKLVFMLEEVCMCMYVCSLEILISFTFYFQNLEILDTHSHGWMVREFAGFTEFTERELQVQTCTSRAWLRHVIYGKYKLYCQQIQSVVASFETVPGLGNAAPYIFSAFKAVSKHFSCLKNAIMDQIQIPEKPIGDTSVGKNTIPGLLTAEQGIPHRSQKPENNQRFLQYPVWRSQRGLPDHAVSLLKTWLFQNFLHPKTVQNIDVSELVFAHISYPTDSEKQMLARQTGLSRTQVSNWFINARVRLWKPMVEEIHKLEKQQSQTPSEAANLDVNMPTSADHQLVTTESGKPEIVPTKRPKHKSIVSIASNQSHEEPNIQNSLLRNLSSSQHIGVTGSSSAGGSCVSLALGLHRNIIRNELSKPVTINIARNLDMETGPEAQNPEKHLGRAGN